ncbi:helix-turn-helix domain-containing protein [Volucribacter amazonae]|uniref:Uncharacterized protein n=1 Tax=Volucribacter amazonae TaxID=256731 RepID=A0A9X4PBG3_9PAST|nr:helix-turn-helix transcriptional regulator [Volucribacter amazonae]MDG6894481.1 hypothetical protein [Volucribacter amazonae]
MEIKDIPQDNSKIFAGQKKVIYATRQGKYEMSTTTGWIEEEFVTQQAVLDLQQKAQEAWQAVKCGQKSIIFYLMYKYRFDETSLAQATGLWKWQVRRHCQPKVFARLSCKTLAKYAQAFQLSIAQLNPLEYHNDEF